MWSALPAVAALVFYLAQAPTATGDGDPGELTLALVLNGVPHPTGYPLYTVLGHAFVHLLHAVGVGWAYAANAWSATGGGVAIFLLHALAARLIPARLDLGRPARFAIALVPTAVFALNPVWTGVTTIAEVYSWHIALMAGMTLRYVGLARRLGPREGARPIRLGREAASWGLLCGLAMAHHLSSVWIAAPLSLAITWMLARSRRPVSAFAGIAALAALAPLLSYLILHQRAQHPGPGVWPTLGASWGDLARHVTGAMYTYELGRYAPHPRFQPLLLNDVYPFLVLSGALLAALVARVRGRGESMVGMGLLGAVLVATAFGFRYGVEDPSPYFLAPMAIGLAAFAPLAADLLAGASSVERTLGRAALAGLLLVLAVRSVPWVRTASGRGRAAIAADQWAHQLWASIPGDSGLVFWADDAYQRFLEYQELRGEHPGLEVLNPIVLTKDVPRRRFVLRHGMDPFEGVPPPRPNDPYAASIFLDTLYKSLNRRMTLPIFFVQPDGRAIWGMTKPGSPATPTPAGRGR